MAQGNALLGQLNGRLGDVVFSRKRGKQQARAYVQNPTNPQTRSQRGQRVKFGTCAAFYRSAVRNLFKFAFEYKKPGESDYNAFLRYNLNNMAVQTRHAYDMGLPCPSDWLLSFGSLTPAEVRCVELVDADVYPAIYLKALDKVTEVKTIGQLSKAFMDSYNLQKGDIVTVVDIYSEFGTGGSLEEMKELRSTVAGNGATAPVWDIQQFILDPDSTDTATAATGFDVANLKNGSMPIIHTGDWTDFFICAAAVIFSRNTKKGVVCSPSRLVSHHVLRQAVALAKSQEWWEFCADDFNLSTSIENLPDDILEGSIARKE